MPDQFACCECGAKKGSKQALKSHISIKHLQWLPYECPHCSAQTRSTREATKQDLLLHINQTHPGQESKYTCLTDPEKKQLLKHKMQQSTNAVVHESSSTSGLQFSVTPPILDVGAKRVKSDVITIDDDDDDDEDSKPPILTAFNTSDGGQQLPVTPEIPNSAPKGNANPELVVGGDDDLEPFAPSNNTGDSQSQQPNVPADLETGHSYQQTTPRATKGYCLTCKRQYSRINDHLETKLSAPVFECSNCCYGAKSRHHFRHHTKAGRKCQGANMVRIRPEEDVAQEMQQLRQTHLGVAPQDWPYRCTECKTGVAQVPCHILKYHLRLECYECSVCGWLWSGRSSADRLLHVRQNHSSTSAKFIHNETKYKTQIQAIANTVIVRNK